MSRKKAKAPNGAGTIEKRTNKKGKVWYVVRFYVTEADGSRKQKSKYFNSFDEADEFRVSAKKLGNPIEDDDSPTLTAEQWLNTWTKHYLVHLKPRTQESYIGQVRYHIIPALGKILLTELRPNAIQTFYNSLTEKHDLSPKTVRIVHGVLHAALRKAVRVGHITENPADACELPRMIKREMIVFDDADTKRFLGAVRGHPYETFYVVDLFTGLRKGEILGLTWDCVDFENSTLNIRRQLNYCKDKSGHWHYVMDTPKNGRARTISIPPYVLKLLREQQARQEQWKQAARNAWQPFDGYDLVFTNELGGHLMSQSVYRQYKALVRSIGCSDMRLHDLRHSYAVAALKSGDDYKTLQSNLGHASSSFTLDVYGHTTNEMKRNSAKRMERHIASLIR